MLKAVKVLQIAEEAFKMLEDESDENRFRVEYYAALTSLRSVGHVLDKIDKKNDEYLSMTIPIWWNDLKQHQNDNRIFFDFIERERNQLIKEGVLNYDSDLAGLYMETENTAISLVELTDNLLYVPSKDGTYRGEDVRDLIKESIEWWKEQFSILGIHMDSD